MARRVIRIVGVAVAALIGVVVAVATIVGVGLLFWLGAKGLVVITWHAIVDGVKESVGGRS